MTATMGPNRREIVIRRGGWTARAKAIVPVGLLSSLLDEPCRPFSEVTTRIVKDGDTTKVARVEWTLSDGPRAVSYKCVRRLGWLKRLTQALGINRTWRTYRAGRRLEELGIATAKPLLILIPDRRRFRASTWIAHAWVNEAEHLGELARQYGRGPDEWRLDDIARELGDILGRLHRTGGTHRDLKPENILARLATESAVSAIWLIDLDGLRFRHRLRSARRRRDLSRLAVGIDESGGVRRATQFRFLHSYCRVLGETVDWKSEWRNLKRATERRMRHRARRRDHGMAWKMTKPDPSG